MAELPPPPPPPITELPPLALGQRPRWQRAIWGVAGLLALGTGIVGAFLPLLPTTPFVLLAAFCFSRSSVRLERWLLGHPRFGPLILGWRASRAIPLRAKQAAWVMMAIGSAWAAWVLPARVGWLPAVVCALVAWWMWTLPSRATSPAPAPSPVPSPVPGRANEAASPRISSDRGRAGGAE